MNEISSDGAPEAHGMEAVKQALSRNGVGERSLSWLSRQLGLSRGATAQWDKVPEEHIAKVAEITKLHPKVIRPDLAELFAEAV